MKFGVFDHLDDAGIAYEDFFENRLRMTEIYDKADFYAYHIAEHHGTPLGLAGSPSVFLAAVAQRTKRIKLGAMVYPLPFYHPVRLLEEIGMLDRLSRGRLQLGVGRGVVPMELGFYGVDFAESGKMYHEAFQLLMKGFASDELTFDGNYYHFKDVPVLVKPMQKPHPPLWYGLVFPDQATWPAANDVNVITLGMREGIRACTDRYRAERAKAGKDSKTEPMIGVTRHVVVAETDAEALRIARRAYQRWENGFFWLFKKYNADSHIEHIYPPTFDELQTIGNGIAGSPKTVREYIEKETDITGVNYFCAWHVFGDMTLEESQRSVDLYTREVMPAFK
jgi:alkanesulfonate monooxygenase SsuD/methylene tetrahydromethanopterin reductase-like flavin-dependent oxidoreductase (luciferase family)